MRVYFIVQEGGHIVHEIYINDNIDEIPQPGETYTLTASNIREGLKEIVRYGFKYGPYKVIESNFIRAQATGEENYHEIILKYIEGEKYENA